MGLPTDIPATPESEAADALSGPVGAWGQVMVVVPANVDARVADAIRRAEQRGAAAERERCADILARQADSQKRLAGAAGEDEASAADAYSHAEFLLRHWSDAIRRGEG